jgi:hypothetical protein
VGLANLGSKSETCVGSLVHLVGVSISLEKNFYQLPFSPPSLVRRIGPSSSLSLLGFRMPTLQGVESIRNRLRVLASFWVFRLSLGPLANNLV